MDVTSYVINRPQAQPLADLAIVEHDLELVMRWLDEIRIGPNFPNHSAVLSEACWASAIIRYARCFTNGVVKWNREFVLNSLSRQGRSTHSHIIDLRNGSYAHSVGSAELSAAYVDVRKDDGGRQEFDKIGFSLGRVACAGSVDIDRFYSLAQEVLGLVAELIDKEYDILYEVISALPVDQLIRDGVLDLQPTLFEPRKPRPRHKEQNDREK
ncbi:hypothetical protein OCJ37_19450 [Xanthomonas sp. AM6]|uniref:hypothetical protein n=1 Tax=Xanthomonas sp. AM6 TaxID=2982531 RepID=UPI0021D9F37B|nr:hypothetical protein [Xanthomonas sp. AM6]UYB52115.1 hypothetical protein OCJ37_19450 [Xanthomonas sp. AM6]